jgi:hypothetical protein
MASMIGSTKDASIDHLSARHRLIRMLSLLEDGFVGDDRTMYIG